VTTVATTTTTTTTTSSPSSTTTTKTVLFKIMKFIGMSPTVCPLLISMFTVQQ